MKWEIQCKKKLHVMKLQMDSMRWIASGHTSFLIFQLLLCFDHFQFAIACLRFFEQVLHSRCPNWFSVTFITQIVPCSIFSTPISTYFILDLTFSLIYYDVQIQKDVYQIKVLILNFCTAALKTSHKSNTHQSGSSSKPHFCLRHHLLLSGQSETQPT